MSSPKSASFEELREMQKRGELVEKRSDAKSEESPDGFWDSAEVQMSRQENS